MNTKQLIVVIYGFMVICLVIFHGDEWQTLLVEWQNKPAHLQIWDSFWRPWQKH
jgi:hypothetical protein